MSDGDSSVFIVKEPWCSTIQQARLIVLLPGTRIQGRGAQVIEFVF